MTLLWLDKKKIGSHCSVIPFATILQLLVLLCTINELNFLRLISFFFLFRPVACSTRRRSKDCTHEKVSFNPTYPPLTRTSRSTHIFTHDIAHVCVCVKGASQSINSNTLWPTALHSNGLHILYNIYIKKIYIYICIYIITKLRGGKNINNINTLNNMIKYVDGTEGLIALEASKQSYIKKRFPNCKSRTHILKRYLPKHLNFA